MTRYFGLDKSAHVNAGKTGVLLVNLGTPEAPEPASLRRYLAEFLSDPRVIEMPRLLWKVILHGIILRVRPAKSAKLYQSIWTESGSPMMVISLKQKQALAQLISKKYADSVIVDLAMRYGQPSIDSVMKSMQKRGVEKFIVLPLYPQYAGPTTGSVFDAISQSLTRWRWVPELHFINSYHDNALYIDALCESIQSHFSENGKPQKLVFSYHGMPKRYHISGDPYFCFCHITTAKVVEKLGLSANEYVMTFQSRFGKEEWLKPYTDETLETLPEQGITDVAIISPAFSADCLETLEELVEENKEVFYQAGGKKYHYIPALNDQGAHIKMMASLVEPYIR